MSVVPDWVEAGQGYLQRRMSELLCGMCEAESAPSADQWGELHKLMVLLHELRAIVTEAPTSQAFAHTTPQAPLHQQVLSDPERGIFVGLVERRLRGGILHADSGQKILVPEYYVARVGMQGGDLVEAQRAGSYVSGDPRYYYSVRNRCGSAAQDRREITGPAERSDSTHFRVRGAEVDVLFSAADFLAHGGFAGCVVTVAYWESAIRDGRADGLVLCSQPGPAEPPAAAEPSPGRPKPAPPKPAELKPKTAVEPTTAFFGQPRVLVVGGRNWPGYREGIRALGAEPDYITGSGPHPNLEAAVASHDIIVLIHQNCGHPASDKAKDVANNRGRLFFMARSENWSGLRLQFTEEIIPAWHRHLAGDSAAD